MIKNENIEYVGGVCEMCGTQTLPENLYVDVFNNIYSLECPFCFNSRNAGKVHDYFSRVKEVIPDVYTEREYNLCKDALIVIGNAFTYVKHGKGSIFLPEECNDCEKDAYKKFFAGDKIKNKFILINSQIKTNIQRTPESTVLIVAVRSYVKFRSYIDFLEHELYMKFRSEVKSSFN